MRAVVYAKPVSRNRARDMWKSYARQLVEAAQACGQAYGSRALYARIYYFHEGPRDGDADNISKPILDALAKQTNRHAVFHVMDDDSQVLWRLVCKVRTDQPGAPYSLPPGLEVDIASQITSRPDVVLIEIGPLSSIVVRTGQEV